MNPDNAYKWASTILFVVLLSGVSAARAQQATNSVLQMPQYAYPFPAYPDPYAVCVTNNVAPVAFLDDYLWTNGEYSCSLRGFAADGQMWLQALVGAGEWSGVWHVSDRDGAMVTLDPEQTLDLSSFPRGIYQVQLGLDATTNLLPTLWVAWPSNAVPAGRFPAAGNVHGKIAKMRNAVRLHVWGHANETLAAAISGGCGVTQACLRIDGRLIPVALDAAGNFDLTLPVQHIRNGVHDIALQVLSMNQTQVFTVDHEYVSENGALFTLPPGDPGSGDDGAGIVATSNDGSFIPSGIAIAFPCLDERGLLVLDGNESIGATLFRWRIRDLVSGVSCFSDVSRVETETLSAGCYEVTLDCNGTNYTYLLAIVDEHGNLVRYPPDPYADQAITQFDLVIPPRVNLALRQANGAVHIRWVPEKINGQWAWCLYLSGHVFEGIGSSVYGFDTANLRASVAINGEIKEAALDNSGRFLERWVAGTNLASVFDVSLTVRTLDDGKEYMVDSLHETRMSLFPPWHGASRSR